MMILSILLGATKTHTSIMWMIKLALNLMLMRHMWMPQMLVKVHNNMKKKAKAILLKTPSLHKNVHANGKQQHKLKLAKK